MADRPRLLDLFCGAGGAAMGYYRAGFEVVGVDIKPQPRYPFKFHQADALTFPLDGFDAYHASPPCQKYVTMSNRWRGQVPKTARHPDHRSDLIAAVREHFAGRVYVIENVEGARPLLRAPIRLTGAFADLQVHRPRFFETSPQLLQPTLPPRRRDSIPVYGPLDGRKLWQRKDGTWLRAPKDLQTAKAAMGIDWDVMWDELREAIPPAYTEYIGRQLLAHLATMRVA